MYKNELPFLNVIRGSSALLVLFFHIFVFFFTAQDMSAGLINAEPLVLPEPFYLPYIEALPFNIGHLGVSFFFLLSGFFILPSLEKYNHVRPFLVHKFLRLWPTYAFCFALGLGVVYVFAELRNDIYPYSLDHILAYFFWMRDIFDYAYIDGSVWTLEVQIKFYILSALIWYFFRHRFLESMTVILLALCTLGFLMKSYGWFEESSLDYLVYHLNKDVKYWLLIAMGTCIYAFYSKKIPLITFMIIGLLLLGCFLSPLTKYSSPELMNAYCLGVFLFACSVFFGNIKKKSDRPVSKVMDWFAKISYPLYVGQVLPGYTVLYYMLSNGMNVYLSLFTATAVVFPIAIFAHKYIEKVFAGIKVEAAPKLG